MDHEHGGKVEAEVKHEGTEHHAHVAHEPAKHHAAPVQKMTITITKNQIISAGVLLVVLLISPFVATAADLYKFHWNNETLMKIASVLPYPVLTVDGQQFTYAQYQTELANLDRILKGQPTTPSRSEKQKMFVDRLKRAAAVKRLSADRKLDMDTALKLAKSLTFGDKVTDADVEKGVKEQFGWSMEYFQNQVLTPFAREMAFALDILKPKAQEISDLVKAPKADFAAIAKEKGEDASKEKGGDLGWFKQGAMVPEFENVVWGMKKGDTSEPFPSRFGWHVVKVTDIRGEGDKKEVRASHIIVTLRQHEAEIEPLITKAEEGVQVQILMQE
jgi:parvulin-like peptidyl-prolyl isomerase